MCTKAGGSCASGAVEGICLCLVSSILRQWDYDLATLQADEDYLTTLSGYGTEDDLRAVLGDAVFEDGQIVSAQALTLSSLLQDRSVVVDGSLEDPINEALEEEVFLATTESVDTNFPGLSVNYFAGRSFSDEFGEAISGDLTLVQVSYVVAFLFVGTLRQSKPFSPKAEMHSL